MVMRKFLLRNRVGFTTSIEEQPLAVAAGTYIDCISLAIVGNLASSATVPTAAFLGLINPFQYKVNGIPWISLTGRDIFALDVLFLKHVPQVIEGAAGQQDKVQGMRIPLSHKVAPAEAVSWLITRSAVTNVSGEVISIGYETREKGVTDIHYDIRAITGTSPPTIGVATAVPDLPRMGNLIGILFYSDTVPTATSELTTLQEIRLYRNDIQELTAEWNEMKSATKYVVDGSMTIPSRAVIEPYSYLDLSDDPWDLSKDRARVDVLFGVANSPYKVIPIYQTAARPKPTA
jgi:hypothetical protein